MKTKLDSFTPAHLKKWTRPDSYMGAEWYSYYRSGFGRYRDSDCLEESNFEHVLAGLKKLPEWENTTGDDEAVSRFVVRESHWAVGWVEWIAIHESDVAALEFCDKCKADVENYPILDEEDFTNREMEAANQIWRDCYRPAERVKYMRDYASQFEFQSFADMLGCARGKYFAGHASELLC